MMRLYTTNTIPARLARKAALVAVQGAAPVKDVLMAKLAGIPIGKLIASKLPMSPRLPRF
ncbi:MAG: hypothetical protein L3J05_07170 [Robiginitomaculum sp.]|nr:hypothetical protein [Robiginitomaculum sp.]